MKYFILVLNIVQYLIVMQTLYITYRNNIELSSDSDSSNEVYNINNINNRNNIVNNSRNSDSENRIINISNTENYNIVTSNLVNSSSSIGENHGKLSNFLNNECVNIQVTLIPII